ncbi:MAG: peptide ABC transporter substrate-binding protein [Thermomicrobiales bacterium]|nr:MAG: peptide ABC transporter substrate-binding protein [Thermomicrobiales bacterium]
MGEIDNVAVMRHMYAHRLSRRRLLQATGAAAGAAIASGAGEIGLRKGGRKATAQEEPKTGGTLIYAMESEADILDPQGASGWVTWRIHRHIFEPLINQDLSRSDVSLPPLVPGLAESWEVSPDGLAYTFKLRPGVTFHDGTPFDAEAAKFNIDRMTNPDFEYYNARAAAFTYFCWLATREVQIIDPMTIRIVQNRPFGEFLNQMVQGTGGTGMISPTAIKKYGTDKVAEHPVGTGPFKFVERVQNEKIVLERNENYWGRKPYLDRIIFRPMPEPAARVNALRAGEVDFIAVPPPDAIESLVNEGYTLAIAEGRKVPHIWYIHLNMKDPVFQDVRVRRAIQHAIDKEGMAHSLLRDTAYRAEGLQAPGNLSFDPDFKIYPYDVERAKALMAEAGYPNGLDKELVFQTSTAGSGQLLPVPMMEWIQRDLEKIGIKIKIEAYEWITYIGMWAAGIPDGVHGMQFSWGQSSGYWLDFTTNSANATPGCCNIGSYSNPKVDELLNAAFGELDDIKRAELYKQADKLIMEDAAFIPVVNDRAPYIMAPYVKGFVHAPEEAFDLTLVWLDR